MATQHHASPMVLSWFQEDVRAYRNQLRRYYRHLPAQWKHWGKWLIRPTYRYQHQEIARLRSLPHYQPTVTNILGQPLEVVDGPTFVPMYKEIFEHHIYCFPTKEERPYIIDGGANIGLSVLYFKKLYPNSRIIAFEPDDRVFAALKNNVEQSGYRDITLLCRALWSSETKLNFMSEGSDAGRLCQGDDASNQVVRTARLRDYLNRQVDFLKLDIEGAETEVLKDCADSLNNVENLFVEYHSFSKEPQTLHTITSILTSAGFRLHVTQPRSLSPEPFMKRYASLGMDLQLNIFAFRP